jgi:hypothetical protein
MLLFKKKFIELIRRGEKTQTVRIWPYRKYREGQRSYIPGIGYIQILAVDAIPLQDLTEADAELDGFATRAALLEEIERLYPAGLANGQQSYRVRFRVLDATEQAAAKEEKAARKRAAGQGPGES